MCFLFGDVNSVCTTCYCKFVPKKFIQQTEILDILVSVVL